MIFRQFQVSEFWAEVSEFFSLDILSFACFPYILFLTIFRDFLRVNQSLAFRIFTTPNAEIFL